MLAYYKKWRAFHTCSPEKKALMRAVDLLKAWKAHQGEGALQITANISQEGLTTLFFAEINDNTLIKHDTVSYKKHYPWMRYKTFLLERAMRPLKATTFHVDASFMALVSMHTRIIECNPFALKRPPKEEYFLTRAYLKKRLFQVVLKECTAHRYIEIIEKYGVEPDITPELFVILRTKENTLFVIIEDDLYMIFEENTNWIEHKFAVQGWTFYKNFQNLSTTITEKSSPYFIREIGVLK